MRIRLATALLLYGFALHATAAKPPPQPPAIPFPETERVELLLTQQELAVEVPGPSGAGMQFGLLGALVETAVKNAVVNNAEKRVGELRNLLLDYPFDARVEAALRRKLVDGGVLNDPDQLQVLRTTWEAGSDAAPGTSTALVLSPQYSMLNTFELLTVKLTLGQMQRTLQAGKKPKQKALFQRTYAFQFPLSKVPGSGPEEDAARWVAFDAPALSLLIDEGIDQVTDMLVYDLSADGRAEAELPNKRMSGNVGGRDFSGRVVRSGDRWLWLRSGNGALRTLVGHFPVDADIVAAMAKDGAESIVEPSAAMPANAANAADAVVEALMEEVGAEPTVEGTETTGAPTDPPQP